MMAALAMTPSTVVTSSAASTPAPISQPQNWAYLIQTHVDAQLREMSLW